MTELLLVAVTPRWRERVIGAEVFAARNKDFDASWGSDEVGLVQVRSSVHARDIWHKWFKHRWRLKYWVNFPRSLPPPSSSRCHQDFLSASVTRVILLTLPFLSNWSNFPPWLWWMCPALAPCPSTLAGLIKENIPWLPIFPQAWQPIILPSTWLETYYA